MATQSLAAIAREIAAEGGLPDDPIEAREYLVSEIRLVRDDVTVAGARRAAAAELGVSADDEADYRRAEAEAAGRSRDRRRKAKRGAKRAAGTVRRETRRPRARGVTSLGLAGGSLTFGGILAQALGLVALFWLLRNVALPERAVSGAASALRWLRDPVPVGVAPTSGG